MLMKWWTTSFALIMGLMIGLQLRMFEDAQRYLNKNPISMVMASELQKDNDPTFCFIHVGKAGGSTVSCQIRMARSGIPQCRNETQNPIVHETPLSKHTRHRFHMSTMPQAPRKLKQCDAFVTVVRNPIDRLVSWYHYEYYEPGKTSTLNLFQQVPRIHEDTSSLFACYPTLNELLEIGLAAPRPMDAPRVVSSRWHKHTAVSGFGPHPTVKECSTLAWDAVQGYRRARNHNRFNYQWYFAPLLSLLSTRPLYVIRMEHLWDDWININRNLLGDRDVQKTDDINVGTHRNHTPLSVMATRNLCHALCSELQWYRRVLQWAANLRPEHVAESTNELLEQCGRATLADFDAPCTDTGRPQNMWVRRWRALLDYRDSWF